MTRAWIVEPLGDHALRLQLRPGDDGAALVRAARALPGVTDVILAEAHLALVREDPASFDPATLRADATVRAPPRRHVVPVRFDGPDLPRVCAHAGLPPHTVIEQLCGRALEVKFLGFLPGFAYLAGLPEALCCPRLPAPRPRVPAGSVALAGDRAGIYPFASPGGWNLLGQAQDFTPLDPSTGLPRLAPGDLVLLCAT